MEAVSECSTELFVSLLKTALLKASERGQVAVRQAEKPCLIICE